jgi:hypothetical protein
MNIQHICDLLLMLSVTIAVSYILILLKNNTPQP